MKLSIVIVNWNVADLLLKCLTSIYQNPPTFTFEVIVVDNASIDESVIQVKTHFPQVHLIQSDQNLGFGPGNNLGINNATGEYTLLLNPDTEIIAGALQATVDYLESQTNTAVIGVKQREASGKLQESCGHFPSLKTMFLQGFFSTLIKLNCLTVARKLARQFHFEWMPVKAMYPFFYFDATHHVDWVMGAFMLIRSNVLKSVGGFDPYFKMYAEEIDLCYRIKSAGWSIQFFSGAEIFHYGGASTKGIALKADAMRCVAMIRFYIKNRSRLSAFVYRVLTFSASFLALVQSTVKLMTAKDDIVQMTRQKLAKLKLRAALNPTYDGLFSFNNQRMKIGFALSAIHRYGGLTRSSWELAQYMSKFHDVSFFTMSAELTGTETFQVEILKVPNIPYLKNWLFAWKVSRQKKLFGLDILNVHGTSGIIQDVVTAQSVHKKWFFWSLKHTAFLSGAWIRKVLNPVHYVTIALELLQYSSKGSKCVIAISNQVKKDLIDQFSIDPNKIAVVHHGVNTSEFDPEHRLATRESIRRDFEIPDNQKVIIFAAHEFRRKGLSVLLEAMAKVHDQNSLLLVVGQDDPVPFKSQIDQLKLSARVRFLGRQNNMSEWYAASDVFAFPTSYEAFGMVITEAMAAGLPVIVPHDAGAAELITHNVDGLLLSKWNNIEELTACLNLLDDQTQCERIGLAARKRTESWTWADAAEKTLETYRWIIQNSSRA